MVKALKLVIIDIRYVSSMPKLMDDKWENANEKCEVFMCSEFAVAWLSKITWGSLNPYRQSNIGDTFLDSMKLVIRKTERWIV
jgi:hypothetical protein